MLAAQTRSLMPLPAPGSWRHAAHVCGFPIEPVLRDAGIVLSDGAKPVMLSMTKLLRTFSQCVERANGYHFPFALGEAFVFEHFAEFDQFISSCTTLRQMLEVATWARELIAPWMTIHLDEVGVEAFLRVKIIAPHGEAVPIDIEARDIWHVREVALAALYQLIKRALRGTSWLMSVRVASAAPAHEPCFRSHFGVPVFFGESVDALVLDRRWLDQPLNAPEPDALSLARRLVERRLNKEASERRILDEVRWALERRPELLREGLEATAGALGLHPRTLQRRLQSEGVKYVDVQSQAKCQRALVMLRRRAISMESISSELGFSDRRAFTFAFKRWTGKSPSAYRSEVNLRSAVR